MIPRQSVDYYRIISKLDEGSVRAFAPGPRSNAVTRGRMRKPKPAPARPVRTDKLAKENYRAASQRMDFELRRQRACHIVPALETRVKRSSPV